ncbi:hypothetical protein ABZT45_47685, partial [Streptomyces sp. NPDC005356]|uniref:hypothetical protein n=1 Tax=unclassified Streptomyces TaxID=2593676 RepID=UPI0033A7C181
MATAPGDADGVAHSAVRAVGAMRCRPVLWQGRVGAVRLGAGAESIMGGAVGNLVVVGVDGSPSGLA